MTPPCGLKIHTERLLVGEHGLGNDMSALAFAFSLGMTLPTRPVLKPPALPLKLAGGLFLFASSVPPQRREASESVLRLAETALRADPRVTMELGMGIEAGGVFGSSSTDDAIVLNFQVNGGNAWAEATAFAWLQPDGPQLLDLTIANMEATVTGIPPLNVALPGQSTGQARPTVTISVAMAAARAREFGDIEEEC